MFEKMMKETKAINIIKKFSLENSLTNKFLIKEIAKLANIIKKNDFLAENYENCVNIQSELIENHCFASYLKGITDCKNEKKIFLDRLIDILKGTDMCVTDFDVSAFENLWGFCSYRKIKTNAILTDYLKKCGNKHDCEVSCLEIIFRNIEYYYSDDQNEGSICDFTDEEFSIFNEPFVSVLIVPYKRIIREFCSALSENTALKDFFKVLYNKGIIINFNTDILNAVSDNNIFEKLKVVIDRIAEVDCAVCFLELWKQDNYYTKEIIVFEKFCENESANNIKNILGSRVKYLNVVYGNKYPFIADINENSIIGSKENLYIYAVTENKRAFLKLIENNRDIFEDKSSQALLFDENFRNHVNINSLNINDVEKAGNIIDKRKFDILWDRNREYTFNEIYELSDCKKDCIEFYLTLDIPKLDDRLLILRQAKKHDLVCVCSGSKDKIKILAEKLSVKSIFRWIKEDFSNAEDINPFTASELLLIYDKRKELIKGIKNVKEAHFLINNSNNCMLDGIDDMEYIRNNLLDIDVMWKKLKEILCLSEEYINDNKNSILDFCMKNGSEIAVKYYENYNDSNKQKDGFLKVVKAVLSDKFNMLKYHNKDLSLEIQTDVSNIQKEVWIKNNFSKYNDVYIREEDDFFAVMLMGVKPVRTCMHYANGNYRECLLSGFDSNKKVLYAYVNGKAVGRAVLRFTKGCYKIPVNKKTNLDFIDVDNEEAEVKENKTNELPILFLERGYFSEINKEFEKIIRKNMIDFVEAKADVMNAVPVISEDYKYVLINSDKYAKQFFNVFISLSKAGGQYLDSLGGSASVSDEGKFHSGSFYLPLTKQ